MLDPFKLILNTYLYYNLDLLSPGAWRYVLFYLGLYKAEREKGYKDG